MTDLTISFHGGKCCGVKVIHNFGYLKSHVDEMMGALLEIPPNNKDKNGYHVNSDERVFHLSAPVETRLERLDRYLAFLREFRPKGLVEVYLMDGRYSQLFWVPLLKERGFVAGPVFRNSNSGNNCHQFYLLMGQD